MVPCVEYIRQGLYLAVGTFQGLAQFNKTLITKVIS